MAENMQVDQPQVDAQGDAQAPMPVGQPQVQVQLENQHALHEYRTATRGAPAPPQVRGPQDPSQFVAGVAPVTHEECTAWLLANSLNDVTFKSVRENMVVLGKSVATGGQDQHFKVRNNPHKCAGKNVMESAMHLLPQVQVMQDYQKAVSGEVGCRAVAPPSRKHVLPGTQIEVFEWQLEAKPVDYGWLRDTVAMCAAPYQVRELLEHLAMPAGLECGDAALAPLLIGAPARKGKSLLAAVHVFFARRLGLKCTYGVSPYKHSVSAATYELLVGLGWWNNPAFLGNCMSLSQGTLNAESTYDFVVYSADQHNDTKALEEFVTARRAKLRRKVGEPAPGQFNGIFYEAVPLAEAGGATFVFVHYRDEAQNLARFGAEDALEKLEKVTIARDELQEEYNDLHAPERDGERGIASKRQSVTDKLAHSQALFQTKQKAHRDQLDKCQENLRKTMGTVAGLQVLISATLLPTLDEKQLWGLVFDEELPDHLDVGQIRTILPPLGPDPALNDYKGIQDVRLVDRWDEEAAGEPRVYTPQAVRMQTVKLLKKRYGRQRDILNHQLNRIARFVGSDDDADDDDDDDEQQGEQVIANLLEHLERVDGWLNNAEQDVPADDEPLFASALLSEKESLLLLDGGPLVKSTLEPLPATPTVLQHLANAARAVCWLRGIVGSDPTASRLVPPPPQPDGSPPAPHRLPTTLVSVHRDVAPSSCKKDRDAPSRRHHHQCYWIAALLELLLQAKHPGFVTIHGEGMDAKKLCRVVQPNGAPVTVAQSYKHRASQGEAKKQITVFEVWVDGDGLAGVCAVQSPVADMGGVAAMVLSSHKTLEAVAKVPIFNLGYMLFDGATTLSHYVPNGVPSRRPDPADPARRWIDVGHEPLLIAPDAILFASSESRPNESKLQIFLRTANDLPYRDPDYKVKALTAANTYGNVVATSLAEDRFVATLRVNAGLPEPDEAPLPAQQPPPPEDDVVRYDNDGNELPRPPPPPPAPANGARKRPYPWEARAAAHRCFLDPGAIVGIEGLCHTGNLSKTKTGRRGSTLQNTLGGVAPMALDQVQAQQGAFLRTNGWVPPPPLPERRVVPRINPVPPAGPEKDLLYYNALIGIAEGAVRDAPIARIAVNSKAKYTSGLTRLFTWLEAQESSGAFRWDAQMPTSCGDQWVDHNPVWDTVLVAFHLEKGHGEKARSDYRTYIRFLGGFLASKEVSDLRNVSQRRLEAVATALEAA